MRAEFAISLLALLVSALSALYARWSVAQAKQANRISLHDRKLEVLSTITQFRAALQTMGENFDTADLYPLLAASDKAKLYFKPSVVADLRQYADAAYELLISRDGAKRLQSIDREVPSEKWAEIFSKVDRCRALEDALIAKVEAEVQVADV